MNVFHGGEKQFAVPGRRVRRRAFQGGDDGIQARKALFLVAGAFFFPGFFGAQEVRKNLLRRLGTKYERFLRGQIGRKKIDCVAAVRFRGAFRGNIVRGTLRKVHDLPCLRRDDFIAERQFAVRFFVVNESVIFSVFHAFCGKLSGNEKHKFDFCYREEIFKTVPGVHKILRSFFVFSIIFCVG